VTSLFRHLLLALATVGGAWLSPASAADELTAVHAKFTGSQSCASTGCHGGGTGRNELIIYERRDRHAVAYGILGKGTSKRIAESLGIVGDLGKAAQCNVCHAPMQAVPPQLLVKGAQLDRGVSCESCHGAADPWLRLHTRPDVNFQQMVAAGLRDLNSLYGRANGCVACHLNLDEPILRAGHPELFFELDRQAQAQPPHYHDARPSLGPRSWLTGQAVALRELSWKLAAKRDERLLVRWKALVWLLRQTPAGQKELPQGEDFAAMQSAADRLARHASQALWTKDEVAVLLRKAMSQHAAFSDAQTTHNDHRRRAEVLVPAIDRLWRALENEKGPQVVAFASALDVATLLATEQEAFEPAKFATALGQLEVAYVRAMER
jgi:hypothetical protein